MRKQFSSDDEEIEPFPYINTNTGFMQFFRDIFRSGRFPYYEEYVDKGIPTYLNDFNSWKNLDIFYHVWKSLII
jgi:hypothetical protein